MKTLEITKKTVLDHITLSPGKTMLTFKWEIPVVPQAIAVIKLHSSRLGIAVLSIDEGRKGVEINMPIQEDESLSELYLLIDKLIAIISCMFDMHNLFVECSIEHNDIISRLKGIVKDFEHNEPKSEQNLEGDCEHACTDVEEVAREQHFRVKLLSVEDQKLRAVKTIHELCGLSLKEAKDFVDLGSGYVIRNATKKQAIIIKNALEVAGTTAEIEAEDG